MRKLLVFLFITVSYLYGSEPAFDENILKIAQLTDGDLTSIYEWSQQFLRKGERWEIQDSKLETKRADIMPLLKAMGLVDAKNPAFMTYTGAIVHGALLSTMQKRLEYLVDQWKAGVRFNHLYFLTGERDIIPEHESYLSIDKNPKTEYDLAIILWEKTPLPEDMRKQVILHFINALKKDAMRPNTVDTVISWLSENPPKGRYLAVSNAPYIVRQDLILRSLSPIDIEIDTIGYAAKSDEKIAIFLDEIARILYFLKNR